MRDWPASTFPKLAAAPAAGRSNSASSAEEMGRTLFCGPFFASAVMAGNALIEAAEESARAELLPGVASGSVTGTLVLDDLDSPSGVGGSVRATDRGRLSGTAAMVVDAHVADLFVVVARASAGLGLYAVESGAEGLEIEPLQVVDLTRKLSRVTFADVAGRAIGEVDGETLDRLWDLMSSALAHEMIGCARRLFETTVNYTKERFQFGRPIGSFQALKHRCADLLLEIEIARALTPPFRALPGRRRGRALRREHGEGGSRRRLHERGASRHPVAGRHRFHLGERHPPLVQARQGFRGAARHAGDPSRADDDDARGRGVTPDRIRREVSAWLEANWRVDRPLIEWREILLEGGWAAPHWPEEWYGRGFTLDQTMVVAEVFREKDVVPAAQVGPRGLASETILACGSDDQKRRFLRPILTGEHTWCQLFSEPGSGSDLAGLSTRRSLRTASGSSTARRSGTRAPITRTSGCSSRARTGTCRSTRGSATSCSTCGSPESRRGRSGR